MMPRTILVAAAAVALAVAAPAGLASATPPEGSTNRTELAILPVGPSSVVLQRLQLQPGASSGWHVHNGPEYSVISSGSVAVQFAGKCEFTDYGFGQIVFIPSNAPHRVVNRSSRIAEAFVSYTVPEDAPVRGDAPSPCP
ncbi:cupin domain-containing protein [Aldersonia kunmingensis]|uniref:cupin domain-containing protein n=1 Tax=Aldersonia kunmingensis TaxID=408066 RepID=UPI0008351C89|nr:cupin domain-containing protein [Aldersonia kunmingensis]